MGKAALPTEANLRRCRPSVRPRPARSWATSRAKPRRKIHGWAHLFAILARAACPFLDDIRLSRQPASATERDEHRLACHNSELPCKFEARTRPDADARRGSTVGNLLRLFPCLLATLGSISADNGKAPLSWTRPVSDASWITRDYSGLI